MDEGIKKEVIEEQARTFLEERIKKHPIIFSVKNIDFTISYPFIEYCLKKGYIFEKGDTVEDFKWIITPSGRGWAYRN